MGNHTLTDLQQSGTTAGRKPKFKRVLLKLSGEALSGIGGSGIDLDQMEYLARRIKAVHDLGVQVAVVIGGGNIWRGEPAAERGMDRSTADHMGMIATVVNALGLRDALEQVGVTTRVQTAIEMNKVAEPYIRLRAIRHLEKGRVVILCGGTGNPYFTTDTAAALRAAEIDAEVIVKATKVDGIYDKDPRKFSDAKRFETLTFQEALNLQLEVMDQTAFTLCRENNQPILVVNFWHEGALEAAVMGDPVGTLVTA
ncbi:MAG: UMP kinase [Anaerolineae bacterium]|nr:UMP kinase [Anaerolineae bacterium]